MSIEAELRAEFDHWERTETATFKALPYVLLAISTLITLFQLVRQVPMHVTLVLGLSAAAALWMLCFRTLRLERRQNRRLMGGYYAGLMLLAACLVAVAPWYGLFTFVGYPQAFQYLRGRRRYAGAAATAMISAAAFMGGVSGINDARMWWAWLAVGLISAGLAGALFYFVEMADHRNDKQKQALVELHEANVKLEAALAENAGLHARLMVQAREAGVLDERQRMAREIHDTLAQGLAGILTQLQAAEQTMDEPPTLRQHLANATNLARESLVEARRTVHAVEPSVLAEARLPDAIGDVARRWSEIHHIDAALTTTGDARPMHTEVEVTLLRTAQEALANVAKHARASRVGLTLSYMEDLVTLDVRDDGVGFDPNAKRVSGSTNGGFGLVGMRQRVQRLAGRLAIESEPGGGTAISAAVPAIPAGGAD
ncbi:sensor histidine kinase [Kitasatospora sp. NPDC001547]|uniref:sensor histidine kinase n=1 Tax=Kitasatospora sp. NPDC001547 TaxID=3364015 RepID=UPI0036C2202A|nr:sensor histidine kinase [Kitasatospora sp. Xyl93]